MILVAAMLLAQTPPPSPPREMVTMGIGGNACRTWEARRRAAGQDRATDKQWLAGFLTGMDFAFQGMGGKALVRNSDDPNVLIGFVDDYCSKHPLDTVATATQYLWLELTQRANR